MNTKRIWTTPPWRVSASIFAALLGTACSDAGDDAPLDDDFRGSNSGTTTALCGYPAPLPLGFVGSSIAGACEGTCWTNGSGGGCSDPGDFGSRVDVYGCTGKTSGSGFSCDGDHNGGVLIGSFDDGAWHDLADFTGDTNYCTFQLDVMRPGSGGNPLRDFLVWERHECYDDPPPPPPCECPGGTDFLGNPVTGECGQTVCGADFHYYSCQDSGWVYEGGECPSCYCPGGTDHLGNPVIGTECGQEVCGADNHYYTCEQSGWQFQGGLCPYEPPCYCPDGTDYLGNPVTGTECGQTVCGADNHYYSCQDQGWQFEGGTCPEPACEQAECPLAQSVVVDGVADDVEQLWKDTGIAVTAGQTLTIGCGPDAGLISWTGPNEGKTCAGEGFEWELSLVPSCPVWSLVAKVGVDGPPQCVGMAGSFVAQGAGPLFLAYNDGDTTSDNQGSWNVDVDLACGCPGEEGDPCVTGIASNGGVVYLDTPTGKADLHAALANDGAAHATVCLDLLGSDFDLTTKDLRDAEFRGVVNGVFFFGTDLRDARFLAGVQNAPFLYANLENTDFGAATIVNGDFAFTQATDAAIWPATTTHSVFTGNSVRSEPMLPHVRVDGNQAVVDALLVEADATNDGLLGSSWRSYLWDAWFLENGVQNYYLKRHVFDAVDQRYGAYLRPAGGPTLLYLYDSLGEPLASEKARDYIETALANLVDSDEPAYLDDPLIGRVSPLHEGQICGAERIDAASWYADLATVTFYWNTAKPTRNASEVALRSATIADIRSRLAGPALAAFDAKASDDLFNLGELQAGGLNADELAIIAAAFDHFVAAC
ncbi:hypothetical protein ACNOYE_03615 [Nannocystaceae bacterium ST9]